MCPNLNNCSNLCTNDISVQMYHWMHVLQMSGFMKDCSGFFKWVCHEGGNPNEMEVKDCKCPVLDLKVFRNVPSNKVSESTWIQPFFREGI